MAASKKPLEFHAKRPWPPEDEEVEDPDEDDEDDNDEAENGFSLEEVLRLGGTKVMASDSRRRETEARGVVPRVARPVTRKPRSCGIGRLDSRFQRGNVFWALPAFNSFPLLFTRGLELNVFMWCRFLRCR